MPKRVELLTWNLNLNGCPIFYLATLRCRVGEAETQKWWGGSMQTSLEEEKGKNYRTVIPAHSLHFFVEDRGLEPWFLEIPSSLWGHNPHHCTFFGKPIGVIHLLIRIFPGPLSKRKRRLDSLEAAQGAPRDREATREESGVLGFPSRRGLTPRGSLECNPEIPAFPGEEY